MITRIPAGNPGPFTGPTGNNTWLIDGAAPLLIDAGVGLDAHIDALKRALGRRALSTVFVTHGHHDHAGGVPRLRAEFPPLEVIGGDDGGRVEPDAWLPAGDGRVQVVATPGHSADHACLWDPVSRALFAGDLLVSGGTVMISASAGGSLRQYLDSLASVRRLNPERVYPGHGPIIDEPIALIDQYIVHRREREAQIIAALEGGARDLEALVASIYPELAETLKPAAAETALAHLRKLEEDGRVIADGPLWSLTR